MHGPADAAEFTADQILAGRYRLVRPLGEGGIGVVWEARQITTDKAVALKVLKSWENGSIERARFLREAKVAAGLSHRNIVQVFDFWDPEDGPPFLVMELLHGETLGAVLARGVPPLSDTLGLLLPVANALVAAHAMGVVHRDLKPENVLLARTAVDQIDVKVLDFGLAKPVTPEAGASSLTSTGSLMGTPYYMSPEQVYGEKTIGVSADVWAFGVVFYECLTGVRPFVGDNFGQIFRAITQTSPRPLRELAPHVPFGLSTLVERMLAQEADARPTMSEISTTLDSFLRAGVFPPTQRIDSHPPLPLRTVVLSTPATTGPAVVTPAAPAMKVSTMTAAAASASVRPEAPRARAGIVLAVVVGIAVTIGALVIVFVTRSDRGHVSDNLPSSPASSPTTDVHASPNVVETISPTANDTPANDTPALSATNEGPTAAVSTTASAAHGVVPSSTSAHPSEKRRVEAPNGKRTSPRHDPLDDGRW